MRTLLKNGRIIDPSVERDEVGSVLMEDGRIVAVGADVDPATPADEVYDLAGLWVCPGLVDLHVHLREPGGSGKETIVTGTRAAAAGGFTTICCMPNTEPALDNAALINFVRDRAASPDAGGVAVEIVGSLTRNNEGQVLADLAGMKRAGVVAASDEEFPVQNASVMQQAMEFCHQLDLPVIAHCEDTALSAGGQMNEGSMAALLGLKGIPRTAEEIATMRNCLLSLHTGCRLHIMRVSTWGAVELVRLAKHLGAKVTCEICPVHFCFTEDEIGEYDTAFKTLPPLRTQLDLDLIIQALTDGTIDCIASDHSPHTGHETDVPFDEAPFGSPQLESTLGATLTHLTHKGHLSPMETVRRLSTTPAAILGLDAGSLQPSQKGPAQVTVIDPTLKWTFDRAKTLSKSKTTPFHGKSFRGKTMLTFRGREIYRAPEFEASRHVAAHSTA